MPVGVGCRGSRLCSIMTNHLMGTNYTSRCHRVDRYYQTSTLHPTPTQNAPSHARFKPDYALVICYLAQSLQRQPASLTITMPSTCCASLPCEGAPSSSGCQGTNTKAAGWLIHTSIHILMQKSSRWHCPTHAKTWPTGMVLRSSNQNCQNATLCLNARQQVLPIAHL